MHNPRQDSQSAASSDSEGTHYIDGRPSKRRRISHVRPDCSPSFQQVALEEIDLEIALRQRIAETIQSRIAWALLLQESLQKGLGHGSDNFRTASLEALDAIEAPCSLIFNRESRLVPPPRRLPADAQSVILPTLPPTDAKPPLQTTSRSSRTRGLARTPFAPPKRLLFIRNTTTSPPEIAKLACPVPTCARSDFSNLQGLLNHCRLRHKLEYGSHDECVQSCAVLVPEGEREWVAANGVEVAGISLPSLRRLFEIAVGAGAGVGLPALASKPPVLPVRAETQAPLDALPLPAEPRAEPSDRAALEQQSSHIGRTLGYHIDTPALAPFLGRAPKKRCINVRANEDENVDIEDVSAGAGLQHRKMWRKPYTHRNVARKELDEVVPWPELPTHTTSEKTYEYHKLKTLQEEGSTVSKSSDLHTIAGTRFHIAARVQITDYSLYTLPNRRPAESPEHSHRWRITVTSPSYSLHISSVLSKLTITSATDPPPSTLADPITLTEPPFAVTSTTDRPFLARLIFTWAGTMNPPTEVEHWVELDPMQHSGPVRGEEQVFDVELDRYTELLPVREDARDVSWEDLQAAEDEEPDPATPKEVETEPDYAVRLKYLLPLFPATVKDAKGRPPARLPYTLVSTPTQFRNLHYGRRKAIEMGRARALQGAYAELVSQLPDAQAAEATPLTTVDVYHWLENEGLYPRSDASEAAAHIQKRPNNAEFSRKAHSIPYVAVFCRECGLERGYHPTISGEGSAADSSSPGADVSKRAATGNANSLCTSFREETTRQLMVDVDVLTIASRAQSQDAVLSLVPYGLCPATFTPGALQHPIPDSFLRDADLVAVADPRLVVAIHHTTGLPYVRGARPTPVLGDGARQGEDEPSPAMPSCTKTPFSSISVSGSMFSNDESRADVEAHLAPSAVLAVAMRTLAQHLVQWGVDALRRDEAALRAIPGRHRQERLRRNAVDGGGGGVRRVLTPAHVLRGVTQHASASVADSALFLCLARLGESSSSPRANP